MHGPYFLCLPTIDISEVFLLTSGNVEREKLSETFPDRMFQCYFQDTQRRYLIAISVLQFGNILIIPLYERNN